MPDNPTPELIEPNEPAPSIRTGKVSHRRIEHFVAPLEETPLQTVDKVDETSAPLSMWNQAWRSLRTQPLFIISALLIISTTLGMFIVDKTLGLKRVLAIESH